MAMDRVILLSLIYEVFLEASNDVDEYFLAFTQLLYNAIIVELMDFRRDHVPRLQNYAEVTVPQYTLDDFKQQFRISRRVFERLLQMIAPHLTSEVSSGSPQVPPEKMTLVMVWYMSNMESMRVQSIIFGISISTVHKVIHQVLCVFQDHLKQVNIEPPL